MTVSCPGARERFGAYLDEALHSEERSAVRSHLAECAACRREAAAVDPALLFAAVPPEDVSPEEKARILEAVRAGIALKAAERRVGKPSRRRIVGAAAGAAAAVAIAFSFSAPSPRRPLAPAAQVSSGAAASESAAAARGVGIEVAGVPALPDRPLSAFAEASGTAKRKVPGDATIYDWNPGGGQPRVVWIVDKSLDI
ncbi:MAG: zf-HC2 domain-containing protein [Acidobacteriota bacterium]|nr:zf-HC2 domain-containing protein [Acidobacteriota bacterium]